MTIKEFARLCTCPTQTLRYYDRIDLLKPSSVNPWSGYRYYTPSQAMDFVKIRHLQSAGFSIDQIRGLLTLSDQQVYDAFEEKIAEQTQRLARMREIQQSYLTDKMSMERIIQGMSDFILAHMNDAGHLRDFGMEPEDRPDIIAAIRTYLEGRLAQDADFPDTLTLTVDGETVRGAAQIARRIGSLAGGRFPDTVTLDDGEVSEEDFSPEQYETVWERQGWATVSQFIDQIPPLEEGYEYCFLFHLAEQPDPDGPSFPMLMLGAMTLRKHAAVCMSCSVLPSPDGHNHFALLRRSEP